MFENLIYPVIGFVGTLLELEAAWHFTACKIPDKTLKLCTYKQIKLVLVSTYVVGRKRKRHRAMFIYLFNHIDTICMVIFHEHFSQ
jgi:hypothetical protein